MNRYQMEGPSQEANGWGWGRFQGTPLTKWSNDGERMTLMEDFGYLDPDGHAWVALAGCLIDGASIPRALWSAVGSPFTGKYREASIVHDFFCVNRKQTWEQTHFMFYQACRCAGESSTKAKLLYWAVYHFGPRWAFDGSRMYRPALNPTQKMVWEAEQFVSKDPSIRDIEETTPWTLGASMGIDQGSTD